MEFMRYGFELKGLQSEVLMILKIILRVFWNAIRG